MAITKELIDGLIVTIQNYIWQMIFHGWLDTPEERIVQQQFN